MRKWTNIMDIFPYINSFLKREIRHMQTTIITHIFAISLMLYQRASLSGSLLKSWNRLLIISHIDSPLNIFVLKEIWISFIDSNTHSSSIFALYEFLFYERSYRKRFWRRLLKIIAKLFIAILFTRFPVKCCRWIFVSYMEKHSWDSNRISMLIVMRKEIGDDNHMKITMNVYCKSHQCVFIFNWMLRIL